tara:strand:+ start:85 stop:441 length:357 start_codon:yes stop_codon:yes gene_type:complete
MMILGVPDSTEIKELAEVKYSNQPLTLVDTSKSELLLDAIAGNCSGDSVFTQLKYKSLFSWFRDNLLVKALCASLIVSLRYLLIHLAFNGWKGNITVALLFESASKSIEINVAGTGSI